MDRIRKRHQARPHDPAADLDHRHRRDGDADARIGDIHRMAEPPGGGNLHPAAVNPAADRNGAAMTRFAAAMVMLTVFADGALAAAPPPSLYSKEYSITVDATALKP